MTLQCFLLWSHNLIPYISGEYPQLTASLIDLNIYPSFSPLQLFFPIVTVIPKFLKALSAASSEIFRFPVSQ